MGKLRAGDLVLLYGDLGAGKTTLVRGYLKAAGHDGDVRSPTFNLLSLYETDPPVAHADLYRLKQWKEIGLEEYLDTHVCFIEWPERAGSLEGDPRAIVVKLGFAADGRNCRISFPEPDAMPSD